VILQTVESSASEFMGNTNSFAASVVRLIHSDHRKI